MYREIMLRNKSIFQISTLVCLSSISICNLLIDLPNYMQNFIKTDLGIQKLTRKGEYSQTHRTEMNFAINC
jgi:hypothetical protein